MSSRRSVRQLVVAVLLGVLVGGGLMAVTPAGAEVSNAVATNWKKIWKKNLKPLADKRYYTKAQSDAKYSTKAETAAGDAASNAATDTKLGSYYKKTETYSKAEADAKYAAAGSSYSKSESDAKYQASAATVRGSFMLLAATGTYDTAQISFGQGFSAAPIARYISIGETPPAGCSGTAAAPNASPGYLCVFESYNSTIGVNMCSSASGATCASESADAYGTTLYMSAGGTTEEVNGTWAARPLAAAPLVLSAAKQPPSPAVGGRLPALN